MDMPMDFLLDGWNSQAVRGSRIADQKDGHHLASALLHDG
jgi:hypothetical protein